MSFATVRKEIKTLLEGVNGIGRVHDYRRHTRAWEEFYARHAKDGRVNNWEITRTALSQEISAVQGQTGNEPYFHDVHATTILGHMAVDDARESEKTFQDLVDEVFASLRNNLLLNGVLIYPPERRSATIPDDFRMFGGVLVHYCEIRFEATERVGG